MYLYTKTQNEGYAEKADTPQIRVCLSRQTHLGWYAE